MREELSRVCGINGGAHSDYVAGEMPQKPLAVRSDQTLSTACELLLNQPRLPHGRAVFHAQSHPMFFGAHSA